MDKTRMQQYMSQLRAMFNKHALYSDESPQYQIPFEPNPGDTVKIRFRTLKNNVDAVYFISGSTRAQMPGGSQNAVTGRGRSVLLLFRTDRSGANFSTDTPGSPFSR